MSISLKERKESLYRKVEIITSHFPTPDNSVITNTFKEIFDQLENEIEDNRTQTASKSEVMLLIQEMRQGFASMEKRFEAVDKRFEAVDKRFEAIDKRFEDLYRYMDKRFDAVDERFEAVDKRFQLMQWTILVGFSMLTFAIGLFGYFLKSN